MTAQRNAPLLVASHAVAWGRFTHVRSTSSLLSLLPRPSQTMYLMLARRPLQRLISQVRQFGAHHDAAEWWRRGAARHCGLAWRGLGIAVDCAKTADATTTGGPTALQWTAARERVADVFVLLTERYAESLSLLDALVGTGRRGATFAETAHEAFRCYDASQPRVPGARCSTPHSTRRALVDPAAVFPAALLPEIEASLVPDVLLYDFFATVFDARLRQFENATQGQTAHRNK